MGSSFVMRAIHIYSLCLVYIYTQRLFILVSFSTRSLSLHEQRSCFARALALLPLCVKDEDSSYEK